MSWRFKASKYKNAAPIVPKPEMCVRDIIVGSYQNYGNNIAASGSFMAFNWEHAGTSVAVLPLDDCGRKSKTMPLLYAHSDTVTDLEFSPFHDGLLATGSLDCLVKIWHIPEAGLTSAITNPEATFSHKQRRIERVGFHPTADFMLHSVSAGTVILWDLSAQDEIYSNNEHPEVIQSISWKRDGTLLSTTCKDKVVRVMDPRISSAITMCADSHQSIKDSRVVWLGDQNRILTTGFDAQRLRQVIVRDLRFFKEPEKTLELDCSTGVLMPLFDADTNMLFLAGKGDSTITYLEVTDKEPFFIEGLRHSGEQTKGACLVPKRALRVMEGEVNRVMQLTSNSVIPIMYQVPRKTYRDFHADLYPDAVGYQSDLTAGQWLSGRNVPVPKMSLDPAKRAQGAAPITVHRGTLKEMTENMRNSGAKKVLDGGDRNGNKASVPTEMILEPQFGPIKGRIRQMEDERESSKLDVLKQSKNEDNFKKASHQNGNGKTDQSVVDNAEKMMPPPPLPTETVVVDSNKLAQEAANGTINPPLVAPTPLPRTSRNNSMTDPSSSEESSTGSPRPSPMPRVTIGSGYKPRLGPKPFAATNANENFSFDKVFAVPQVPGQESGETAASANKSNNNNNTNGNSSGNNGSVEEVEEIGEESAPVVVEESKQVAEVKPEPPVEEKQSPSPPATIEEVHLRPPLSRGSSNDEVDDNVCRESISIADRRKLYEFKSMSIQEDKVASPTPLRRRNSFKQTNGNKAEEQAAAVAMPPPPVAVVAPVPAASSSTDQSATSVAAVGKRTSTVFGRVSKFRHLKGTPLHKSTQIDNVRNISRQLGGECDGFQANHERVAVPLAGPGGKIAIYELTKTGRLPDGVIPSLVNGSNIMDFQWDPFNPKRLAVACDDGTVKFWLIPEGGLTEPINTPDAELVAHTDKIYFIKFHPCAKDVLLTASYDMTMKIWNVNDRQKERICLTGHTDQIFSFAWSPCGQFGATVCRDGKVRIYNPRKSSEPIQEGVGPSGTRGGRIVWAIDGEYLVVTGFDKVSERKISVYKKTNISQPLNTIGLDVTPAILVPFYDEDSSTLFVTGKGDSTIFTFDITDEAPFVCPLSHHRSGTSHQGLSFLMKNQCNVTIVEFAKALRLTNNTIEWLSFTVPRLKSELFQDDLFPPTRVTWNASMTAEEWFDVNIKDKSQMKISLQPEDMATLSSSRPAPTSAVSAGTTNVQSGSAAGIVDPMDFNPSRAAAFGDSRKQKEQDLKMALSSRMEANLSKVVHDEENGVEEKEWEDN